MIERKIYHWSGGKEIHNRFVPISEDKSFFTYNCRFSGYFQIDDGDKIYISGNMTGIDELYNESGDVPYGWGRCAFVDNDGDELWSRWDVTLSDNGEYDGLHTFEGGSGKWKGCAGKMPTELILCPHDPFKEAFAILVGNGTISFPE
jgi:hypothetical protein